MSAINHIADVLTAAPPTPGCFPDRLQWSEYLLSAQRYSKARVLPFAGGIYQPSWNFCNDCTRAHEAAMSAAGKCKPTMFLVKSKEIA